MADSTETEERSKGVKKIRWWVLFRRAHLYLGCFFTPMLMFYLLSGWYQSVNNERLKHPSEAETLLQKMRAVHVDHLYPSETEFESPSDPALFRLLAVVMCISALLAIVLGVMIAFKTLKNRWLVVLTLIAGAAVPVLVLLTAQGRG